MSDPRPPAATVERVVVVLGATDRTLDSLLRSVGLRPVMRAGDATIWAPPAPRPAEIPAGPSGPVPGCQQRLLTIPQVAERLNIGRSTVYQLIAGGQIPVVHVGRSARVRTDAIDGWLDTGLRPAPSLPAA